MKGDFSRDTFHRLHHYTRVLHQQGRVQMDSDVNEQTSILLHLLHTFGADLIGPHGGPAEGLGFEILRDITTATTALKGILSAEELTKLADPLKVSPVIAPGHYYVDGLLLENEAPVMLFKDKDPDIFPEFQPHRARNLLEIQPTAETEVGLIKGLALNQATPCIVYLDAWEHHVTHIEADHIREVALGGPDTTTRTQVAWQVRVAEISKDTLGKEFRPDEPADRPTKFTARRWREWIKQHEGIAPKLRARIKNAQPADPDPCSLSPEARYRWLENQLYRIEVHQGGPAGKATFKWSRENGSVLTQWLESGGNQVTVANAQGFQSGDWIEFVDDAHELERIPGTLIRIVNVEGQVITLDQTVNTINRKDFPLNPRIRRWDHGTPAKPMTLNMDGAVNVIESNAEKDPWMALEYGLEIQFEKLEPIMHQYRTGDYWLIPARILLPPPDQIEWPKKTDGSAMFLEPHGVKHHYAPLAFWDGTNLVSQRRTFESLAK
jgi:Family of unknown function (DUF6519)